LDVRKFDYQLPEELIAQEPLLDRAASRMLVLERARGCIRHDVFRAFPRYVRAGDCLVLNDTRVIIGRLRGRRSDTGGRTEVLLLRRVRGTEWEALVSPGRRARPGIEIEFDAGPAARVVDGRPDGQSRIVFDGTPREVREALDRVGRVPTPPYIKKELRDPERYQTVYARREGSAAAPTAGLHFTDEILEEVQRAGASVARVTLHVGLGTFQPVRVERVEDHVMHGEHYAIGERAAGEVNGARRRGGRVIAVGTTAARALESAYEPGEGVRAKNGVTDLFIYPGYRFRVVDALLTNFHLPRSTLLMMVSAFAGLDQILRAYREAVERRYRFYSFGDCMLIL